MSENQKELLNTASQTIGDCINNLFMCGCDPEKNKHTALLFCYKLL